jgi:hypothetical protein
MLIDSAAIGKELGKWQDEATRFDRSFRLALAEPGNPARRWCGTVWRTTNQCIARASPSPVGGSGRPRYCWWR